MTTTTTPSHPLSSHALALLSDLHTALSTDDPHGRARRAVGFLTAVVDPARADRLHPRAGEPATLVERLAVWALHRADDDAVALSARILSGADEPTTTSAHAASQASTSAADAHEGALC